MKVHTARKEYTDALPKWARCREVYAGGDAVKARGELYLPKLSGQDTAGYTAYLNRAEFFEATARTVDGLTGVVMRREPAVAVPKALDPLTDDVTLAGVTLTSFTQTAMLEVLTVGRGGVLIDYATQAKRPYLVWYAAESIVNWRTQFIGGDERLVLVVLKEEIEAPKPDDPFITETATRYRVLQLVNGVVEVAQWQPKAGSADEWELVPEAPGLPNPLRLERAGAAFDEIPFVFVGPEDASPIVRKPPLLGLVDTNLSHFRTSADLEHGAHFTGLPTPYITGHKDTSSTLRIGAGVAWVIPEADARVGMLEFAGQGLGALERLMDRKEVRMAILGARLLEPSKNVVESSDTHRIRQSGDESVLKRIAGAVSQSLTTALQWMAWWSGVGDDALGAVRCDLNTAFAVVTASPQDLQAWLQALQAGQMSQETFYWLCTRAEIARPGVTYAEERLAIDADQGNEPEPPPEPEPPGPAAAPGAPPDGTEGADDDEAAA